MHKRPCRVNLHGLFYAPNLNQEENMSKKMHIKQKTARSLLAILMAVLFIISAAIPAFAAQVKGIVHVGFYALQTDCTVSTMLVTSRMQSKTLDVNVTHKAAYCLEHDKGTVSGAGYTEWSGLPPDKRKIYSDILALGFQFSGSTNWAAGTE